MRSLVRLYGVRALEKAIAGEEHPPPDLLAFVDVHDSYGTTADGRQAHACTEVWCPGYELAKAFLSEARSAAETLVREHGVHVAPPLHDEVAALPADLVRAFNDHVAALAAATVAPYGIAT